MDLRSLWQNVRLHMRIFLVWNTENVNPDLADVQLLRENTSRPPDTYVIQDLALTVENQLSLAGFLFFFLILFQYSPGVEGQEQSKKKKVLSHKKHKYFIVGFLTFSTISNPRCIAMYVSHVSFRFVVWNQLRRSSDIPVPARPSVPVAITEGES